MNAESIKNTISTEKKIWKDTWAHHKGYSLSLIMHPVFGLIDAATTYIGINAGKPELNYLPNLIMENFGIETFCLSRIALGVGFAFAIEKYIRRSESDSERAAFWISNTAHTSNVYMAVNNVPVIFFL